MNFAVYLLLALHSSVFSTDQPVIEEPTACEVCAVLARDYTTTAKKKHGKRDELAAIEVLEDTLRGLLEYKLHKDKEGVERFQKRESSTMETIKKLRDRGVKVELGLPEEMWDHASVETAQLKQRVEALADEYEEVLEAWFLDSTGEAEPLEEVLCRKRALIGKNADCLPRRNNGPDEL